MEDFLIVQKPTYEELEQKVKELEKSSDIGPQFGKQLQILPLAIEQSSEGYAVSDMHGNLEYLNDAFAQIHGYSAEELNQIQEFDQMRISQGQRFFCKSSINR